MEEEAPGAPTETSEDARGSRAARLDTGGGGAYSSA